MSSSHNKISSQLKTLIKASVEESKKLNEKEDNIIPKENDTYNKLKKKFNAVRDIHDFAITSGQSARAETKLAKVYELKALLENM